MFSFNLALPNENSFVFNTPGITPFVKPYGIKFVHIICIGGGGGGGASGVTSATAGAGGSGGGAAGITTGIFPADFLPDTLYVSVGAGGAGGSAENHSAASTAGGLSAIYLLNQVSTTTNGILLMAPGGNGAAGSIDATVGAAGALVSAAIITQMPAASIGTFTSMDGPAGGAGATASNSPAYAFTPTAVVSVVALESSIVCGGAGGGAVNSVDSAISGGSVEVTTNALGNINLPTITGGTTSTNADNGTFLFNPYFVSLGGAGGGGSVTTNKPGGVGGMGSGGGGGGGGRTANGTSNGGNGGNGIVIISCW